MNLIRTESDGICFLTFDRPGSSANIFDRATLEELDRHLASLENETGARGVVLASAKPKIFIAGADLNTLGKTTDEAAVAAIIDFGQRVFTRLSRLTIPSVAAIHGMCLGGGLEMALACDWRVASLAKTTKLGLPETQLGILPAWGGSTRLPKLIGMPQAFGLILSGKQIVAAQALKLRLVDELAHAEYLLDVAQKLVARGKRPAAKHSWLSRAPLSSLVARRARREIMAKTRGHYPAPVVAIEVCQGAAGEPVEQGLAREKAAFLQLVRTPECRNLMSIFFLQERAKKLSLSAAKSADLPVRRVAVIGAGTMGAGIAQWLSVRGYPVRLKDVNADALARGLHGIEKIYAEAVKRRVFTPTEATAGLDRITPIHTDVPLGDVDLVIEAAVEKLELKQQIFRELEARVRADTVLATNTSALSIEAIASMLERPERVVGLHFFNPVQRMQLIEVIRGPRTSPAALDAALQFAKAIGKLPVLAKDSPGFIVNRILMPYLAEAVRIFSEGAPVAAIDQMMLDFGMPMGPLRLCDEVGLDVAQHVAKDLEHRLPHPVPINDTLEKMIAKGWLGKKSGRGFYRYEVKSGKEVPNPDLKFLQQGTASRAPNDTAARLDRMALIMINEAARVLDERVAEAPDDIDFAMIMGTGWAPFRGGPLRYADARGLDQIVARLGALAHDVAPHFQPCESLCAMAQEGRKFYDQAAPSEPASQPKSADVHEPTIA